MFLLCAIMSSAQKIEYKVLSNDPPEAPRVSINLDVFQLDLMQRSLEGWSMNVGTWGHFEAVPGRVGVQYLYRKSWFAFGRLGEKNFKPNTDLELGGYFNFQNRLKNKPTKVVLKKEYSGSTYSTNYKGETTREYTETTTYMTLPSNQRKIKALRGGICSKTHGNSMRYLGDAYNLSNNPEYVKFNSFGFYAGINARTITSIFVDTKQFGVQFNSIGRDVYLDLLVIPSNKFHDLNGNEITKTIKQYTSSGPLGFRLGYKMFQIDKRVKTGKMFGMSATFEAGVRPYTGIFMNAGIGLTLFK